MGLREKWVLRWRQRCPCRLTPSASGWRSSPSESWALRPRCWACGMGAQATLAELLTQARAEFATQRDSLVALRLEAQQEAVAQHQATERLYAGASSGFVALQAEVQGQGQELQRLAGLAAVGHGGGPAPAPGAPGPLQTTGRDPWSQSW